MSEQQKKYRTPHANIKSLIWNKTFGKCWYCGKQMDPFGVATNSFSIDHITSRKDGGGDEIVNLVPCCQYCNIVKGRGGIERLRRFAVGEQGKFYFEAEGLIP